MTIESMMMRIFGYLAVFAQIALIASFSQDSYSCDAGIGPNDTKIVAEKIGRVNSIKPVKNFKRTELYTFAKRYIKGEFETTADYNLKITKNQRSISNKLFTLPVHDAKLRYDADLGRFEISQPDTFAYKIELSEQEIQQLLKEQNIDQNLIAFLRMQSPGMAVRSLWFRDRLNGWHSLDGFLDYRDYNAAEITGDDGHAINSTAVSIKPKEASRFANVGLAVSGVIRINNDVISAQNADKLQLIVDGFSYDGSPETRLKVLAIHLYNTRTGAVYKSLTRLPSPCPPVYRPTELVHLPLMQAGFDRRPIPTGLYAVIATEQMIGEVPPQHHPSNLMPGYPSSALVQRAEGRSVVRAHVGSDGHVGDQLWIEESSGSDVLDHAATETVRSWRFYPAQRHGSAVEMWIEVPIEYKLP